MSLDTTEQIFNTHTEIQRALAWESKSTVISPSPSSLGPQGPRRKPQSLAWLSEGLGPLQLP